MSGSLRPGGWHEGRVPARRPLSRPATPRLQNVLATYVADGGSVPNAADLVGIRPSTVKHQLAETILRPSRPGGSRFRNVGPAWTTRLDRPLGPHRGTYPRSGGNRRW